MIRISSYLSVLEAQQQHFLHQCQPGVLRVSRVFVLLLAAASLLLLIAGLLLSVGVANGLSPPLNEARSPLG